MKKKILLTGHPGCGKNDTDQTRREKFGTTRRWFLHRGHPRLQRPRRLQAGDARRRLGGVGLCRFQNARTPRKYGLDLSALETIAAPAVRGAVQPRQLVVIDEIGPMVRPDDLDRLISELSERIQALNLG